jgi:ankyrin repeat protein
LRIHGCPDQPVFCLIPHLKAAIECLFDTMAAARKARELGEDRTTPLINAAGVGHAKNVLSVLIGRAGVNKPEPCNGSTALHVAAHLGQREAGVCLLDHGADVNAKDTKGF